MFFLHSWYTLHTGYCWDVKQSSLPGASSGTASECSGYASMGSVSGSYWLTWLAYMVDMGTWWSTTAGLRIMVSSPFYRMVMESLYVLLLLGISCR